MSIFAKFYQGSEVSDVPVLTSGGVPMPTNSAYMTPGIYSFRGYVLDCTRTGLYVIRTEDSPNFVNKIVLGSDIYEIMSAICWNHLHGTADNSWPTWQELSNRGRWGTWRLTCGYISGMVDWLMPQIGVSSRVLTVITLGPKNGYDDGHTVIETFHNGKWCMWDLTMKRYFVDANGQHMSTAELIAAIANGGAMPQHIDLAPGAPRVSSDVANINNGSNVLDYRRYWENFVSTPQQIEDWYRRCFQSFI